MTEENTLYKVKIVTNFQAAFRIESYGLSKDIGEKGCLA
jgi:hypothetical protein